MRKSSALHVGLDVHANSIDVTVAEAGADREVRHVGSVGGDLASLDRVLRKLHGEGAKLHLTRAPTLPPTCAGAMPTQRRRR
jgi:hypothetical protein